MIKLNYRVLIADKAKDILHTFLVSKPEAILVYFPKGLDLQEIAKVRSMDSKIPIAIVTNNQDGNLYGQMNHEATKVITQDKVAGYIQELWLRPCKI